MVTETSIAGVRARLAEHRQRGARIALVPTMGALHDGHIALVAEAKRSSDVVVASVFVNPLQFGPNEDFSRYPRTLDADAEKLAASGTDILFAPAAAELYADGSRTLVQPRDVANNLEGRLRPGHFTGVLTVVAKLFNIIQPAVAVFGRKDLQQLVLIRAMVADLNFPVEIVDVETVREVDGLALSSRNRYLDATARQSATRLREALLAAKSAFDAGATSRRAVEDAGEVVLARDKSIAVDYLTVVGAADFQPPEVVRSGDSIAAAIRVGGTRLIDNIRL
jgi:pantoate--beta-alanine ligase